MKPFIASTGANLKSGTLLTGTATISSSESIHFVATINLSACASGLIEGTPAADSTPQCRFSGGATICTDQYALIALYLRSVCRHSHGRDQLRLRIRSHGCDLLQITFPRAR